MIKILKEELKLKILKDKLDKLAKTPVYNTPKFGKLLDEKFELESLIAEKRQRQFQLKGLSEEQQVQMKVRHFTMHLPAYTTPEQYEFIKNVAVDVINNEPVAVVHHEALKRLLRWTYTYRNLLVEFDEGDRWTDEEDHDLGKIAAEFKPILDWLVSTYKLNINKFRRD